MKLEDFVNPIRLDRRSNTTDHPLIKDVLSHLLYLINEAEEHNLGKWSISEIYHSTARDLLDLCTDPSSPVNHDARALKPGLVT